MDPVATIRDALVDLLNAEPFALPFTAAAPYYLAPDPTDTTLFVCVFPRSDDAEAWWTTDTDQSEIEMAVLIRQRLADTADATVDPLIALSRAIRNAIRNAHPLCQVGEYNVNLESIRHAPLWSPELLRTEQLFVSILVITYKSEYEA